LKLSPELKALAFDGLLVRGAIIKFRAVGDELDDLGINSRLKYFVVLSLDVSMPEIWGAYFTSKVAERRAIQNQDHLVQVEQTEYEFLTCRSGITLYNLLSLSRQTLFERYADGELSFMGTLRKEHLGLAEKILRESRTLERRKKARVVA
jgi:hypothetical protein